MTDNPNLLVDSDCGASGGESVCPRTKSPFVKAIAADEVVDSAEVVEHVSRRRLLGSYYTPDHMAEILSGWAITGAQGNVLDPSFGGCAFMAAAAETLRVRGRAEPGRSVFGIDIDSQCVEHVKGDPRLREENVLIGDFLSLAPADVPGYPFSAVLGNPPFVRSHWMSKSSRKNAANVVLASREALPRTASLWAYFVLHSTEFLSPDGRLAMLVPEAILQSQYGIVVRQALRRRFARTRLVHLRERLFEGTGEAVVVIAAEGYGETGELHTGAVDSARTLERVLKRDKLSVQVLTTSNGRQVSRCILNELSRIEKSGRTIRLGDVARTTLGVVTGASNHFVRSREELNELRIPSRARRPIVAKASHLSGLLFTRSDHGRLVKGGGRTLLVRPDTSMDDDPGVLLWKEEGEEAGVHKGYKCAARSPWYRVSLPPTPHAFIAPMIANGPKFVLNRSSSWCTNTLYALTWSCEDEDLPIRAVVSTLTTPVAMWCEVNGRRYGEGMLKLDLSTVHNLPILPCRTDANVVVELDELLREGLIDEARMLADTTLQTWKGGITRVGVMRMRDALIDLRARRRSSGAG